MQSLTLNQTEFPLEYYPSIDEVLGKKDQRYFGKGFKQVDYKFADYNFSLEQRRLELFVDIRYPENWSKKDANKQLAPHLSSIDATLLNCFSIEYLLNTFFDFDQLITPVLIKYVDIRAGGLPNQSLQGIPLSASLLSHEKSRHGFYPYHAKFQVKIGGMTIETLVEHGAQTRDSALIRSPNDYDSKRLSYFQECLRGVSLDCDHEISDVDLDLKLKIARGHFHISVIDTQNKAFLSPIEVILCFAQLAQALIYRTEKIDRSQSDTLWMRSILMENISHFHDIGDCQVVVRMESAKTLKMRGDTWSIFHMIGTVGSSRCAFSVTHKISDSFKELTA